MSRPVGLSGSGRSRSATALRAARLAAGFTTAASAASHFGWSLARYRSHESGTRNPSLEDFETYGVAFRIRTRLLIAPEPTVVDKLFKESLEPARQSQKERSQRLRSARVLAGYSTAKSAASALGIQNFTYAKHENGQNGIRDELLEFYAGWFGVKKEWLSTGRLPTSLGSGIDRVIGQVLKDPASYVSLVEKPFARTPFEDVSELPTGRPPSQCLVLPDYAISVLEASRMDFSILKPTGLIRLPSTGSSRAGLFAVHADEKRHRFDKGARIFVARSSWANEAAEYLIWDGRFLAVDTLDRPFINSSSLTIVGRVIGRLENTASD